MKNIIVGLLLCIMVGCGLDEDYNPIVTPLAQTIAPLNVTSKKAVLIGKCLDGGDQVLERGFYYLHLDKDLDFSEMKPHELTAYIMNNGNRVEAPNSGVFEKEVDGLLKLQSYATMAYVKTASGVSFANLIAFETPGDIAPSISITPEYLKNENRDIEVSACLKAPGGDDISEMGLVWSNVNANPTIEDDQVIAVDPVIGDFSVKMNSLNEFTKYYIRVYAKNSFGITYSDNLMALFMSDTFVDPRDGQSYGVKQFGNSVWMIQNFRYLPKEKLNNGVWVQNENYPTVEKAMASKYYNSFGCLYDNESAQALAPKGWHLATDEEWIELEILTGMSRDVAILDNEWRGNTNYKLKTSTWDGVGAWDNSLNFNVHPSGKNWCGGAFQDNGSLAFFWTSTINENRQDKNKNYYYRFFSGGSATGRFSDFPAQVALSVRYVMD